MTLHELRERPLERLLSAADVKAYCKLSRTTLWRYTRDGHFPMPVRVGPRRVLWRESDVVRWQNERPVKRVDLEGAA